MKAVVFAYHNMGRLGIRKLFDTGFDIPLVFTHTEDPHENIWFGSVSELCKKLSLDHVTPDSPNTKDWIKRIQELKPDIIFSFYYRYMLSKDILAVPPYGAYNLHGSLLPAYRGRCPVNWVIIKGEHVTGVTLHEMVEKPDAGSIVAQRSLEIAPDDTAHILFNKIETEAAKLLDEILPRIKRGDIPKIPQDLSKGSYYGGRKPDDGRIFWDRPALEIYNLIRGVTRPYPGAFSHLSDKKILFWWATAEQDQTLSPGLITIKKNIPLIGTGLGCISPHEIEADGTVLKGRSVVDFFKKHEGEQLK